MVCAAVRGCYMAGRLATSLTSLIGPQTVDRIFRIILSHQILYEVCTRINSRKFTFMLRFWSKFLLLKTPKYGVRNGTRFLRFYQKLPETLSTSGILTATLLYSNGITPIGFLILQMFLILLHM